MCITRTAGVKIFCARNALESLKRSAHHLCMKRTKNPKRHLRRTFIKQWRKHRGLSQERLAERLNVSHTTIGRIERGEIPYRQELLEACADALACGVPDLIMRDPTDPEGIWSIWDGLTLPQRKQVAAVARAIKDTGTGG